MALDLHPLKSGVFERSVVLALAHVAWEMTSAEGLPGWKVPELRKGLMSLVLERRSPADHRGPKHGCAAAGTA